MSEKKESYAYGEGLKAREELKSKSLKLAYEISEEVEKATQTRLTFEKFDFVFKKTHSAAIEGYCSATLVALEAISQAFKKN